MMKFISLSSGSKQNCFYIESEDSSLLIDAGISYSMLRNFLGELGRDPKDIGTILITHEHSDHVRGLRSILRNLSIPVFINKKSWMKLGMNEGKFYPLEDGKVLKWNDLRIMPFEVPHDAANTFGFVIRRENRGIFFASDLGSYNPSIAALAKEANLIAVESNYDPEMLSQSVYPKFLRDRIAHSHGHLSNPDASRFVRETAGMFTEQVCFLHMSENNNRFDIIQHGIEEELAPLYRNLEFHIAVRENPIPAIEI